VKINTYVKIHRCTKNHYSRNFVRIR